MAKTVVGLFDTLKEAQNVVQDLVDGGFDRNTVSVVANDAKGEFSNMKLGENGGNTGADVADTADKAGKAAGAGAVGGTVVGGGLGLLAGLGAIVIPGIGPVIAAGTIATVLGSAALGAGIGAGIGAVGGGLIGALTNVGVPEEDAQYYTEGVRRGGTLVIVNAPDDKAARAHQIMEDYGAVDIDERSGEWKQSGYKGIDANTQPYSASEIDTFRSNVKPVARAETRTTTTNTNMANTPARTMEQGKEVLPVVEEELQVGKRQVQRGGVRVYSSVTEKPVEAQVSLHEEQVNVERRPVNRPVTDADMAAFKEGAIEVTAMAEEAVVSKQARVVEEVVVDKTAQDRTQTVSDTVRRTDVQVEQLAGQTNVATTGTTNMKTFEGYDTEFRNHYTTNYGKSGIAYDQYMPVYQYGYNLHSDNRYAGNDWSKIEGNVRQDWEKRNPNTWDKFKDAVKYAWERGQKS